METYKEDTDLKLNVYLTSDYIVPDNTCFNNISKFIHCI